MGKVQLSASILSANFCYLADSVRSVLDAGVERIHFDVMDQHYVPNLSMGLMFCAALRQEGFTVPIDVHLMTYHVEALIQASVRAKATMIIVHPQACKQLEHALALIRDLGCLAGVALNPDTAEDCLQALHAQVDHVLVMGVKPGFSGQAWMPESEAKVRAVCALRSQLGASFSVGIDGGVNEQNAKVLRAAGADILVSGSTLFHSQDQAQTVRLMRAG
jgi:ribulose-phosphate 3-epimerase